MRPYKHLWANVLWQAVLDAVRFAKATRPTPSAIRADALDWFASNDNTIGSFVWICELMHLDPVCVRKAVGKMVAASNNAELTKMPRFLVQAV